MRGSDGDKECRGRRGRKKRGINWGVVMLSNTTSGACAAIMTRNVGRRVINNNLRRERQTSKVKAGYNKWGEDEGEKKKEKSFLCCSSRGAMTFLPRRGRWWMMARKDERVNGRAAPECSLVGAVATAELAGGNRWELGVWVGKRWLSYG